MKMVEYKRSPGWGRGMFLAREVAPSARLNEEEAMSRSVVSER